MIDFTEGGLTDIWPNKSSQPPEIRALSFAIQEAMKMIRDRADRSMCYAGIDQLPEDVLDYMALDLRSMYYDQNLSVRQKREIIKNTLKWYAHAGTKSAVTEMINIVFGGGEVLEWFEMENEPPGTFWIKTDTILFPEYFSQVTKTIKMVKNTRSHLRGIRVDRRIPITQYVGAGNILKPHLTIWSEELNHVELSVFVGVGNVISSHITIM